MTVRRPSYPCAHFVDALLRHLEAVGFAGAPRVLGYDNQGRQVLTFIDGTVPHLMPFNLSDEQLLSAAELVLAFHDAMATSPLCDGQEVVCHGDLGPHNTVFRGPRAVAIIDWDSDVRPGRRADDFAHAVWCFADLTEAAVPVAEQARRTRLMCSAYPNMTPGIVVAELIDRFQRAVTSTPRQDESGPPRSLTGSWAGWPPTVRSWQPPAEGSASGTLLTVRSGPKWLVHPFGRDAG